MDLLSKSEIKDKTLGIGKIRIKQMKSLEDCWELKLQVKSKLNDLNIKFCSTKVGENKKIQFLQNSDM